MSLSAAPTTFDGAMPPGCVRWAWRLHAPQVPAEPLARQWLAGRAVGRPGRVAAGHAMRAGVRACDGALSRWDCNWSHSGDGLLIALGHDVQVGIDLERLRHRAARAGAGAALLHRAGAGVAACRAVDRRARPSFPAPVVRQGSGAEGARPRHLLRPAPAALRPGRRRRCGWPNAIPRSARPKPGRCRNCSPAPEYLGALAWRPA